MAEAEAVAAAAAAAAAEKEKEEEEHSLPQNAHQAVKIIRRRDNDRQGGIDDEDAEDIVYASGLFQKGS